MNRFRLIPFFLALSLVLSACAVTTTNTTPTVPRTKILLFSQQQVQTLAFEMAKEKGYFAAENLDVEFKYFASGTTALQTFKAGEGNLVYSGDVPAMAYWADSGKQYTIVAPVERNSKGYQLVTKVAIKTAADLKGKTIATRVGSSGSHFIWAYFKKHGLTENDVKVQNLDGQVMVSALDRGDIDGFFMWTPFPGRAMEISGNKIHAMTDASEVVSGYYTLLGGHPDWVRQNSDAVTRFLRAARKGQDYALANPEEMQKYLKDKFDLDPAASASLQKNEQYLLSMDEGFFKDMAGIADWMTETKILKDKLDFSSFTYVDALQKLDPKLVAPVPK